MENPDPSEQLNIIVAGDGLHRSSNSPPETKLRWLRSQIMGNTVEFSSPFGRRRIMYADTTASGQSLLYIENYLLRHILPFYGNTHTSDSYVGQRTTRKLKEANRYIKKCLGGGEDDAILFCGTGSTGAIKRLQEVMGVAVPPTLRDRVAKTVLKEEERWVVFVGPHEHHSNLLSWRNSLAEVVELGMTHDGLVDIQALQDHLEAYKASKRPMMGSFSASSNVTGVDSDTRAIATLLHRYGAFACFDFAASGPHVKIAMRSGEMDGYDAIFLSPHKFLGGPGSPEILLMNKALYLLNSTSPSTCAGGTVYYANGFNEEDTLYFEDIEERENAGTPAITQTIRAALAFWVKEYIGHQIIADIEKHYIQKAIARLAKNEYIEILGNTKATRQAILAFLVYPNRWKTGCHERVKPLHGPFVAKLLNDLFGIQTRGGCACAGPYAHHLLHIDKNYSIALRSFLQKGYIGMKPGWTRISFPFYLLNEEFEFILDAIEFVAQYGKMFLLLYNFDLKTGCWSIKSDPLVLDVLQMVSKYTKETFVIDSSKWSEAITRTSNNKLVTDQIHDKVQAKMTQRRESYKKIAMYLVTNLLSKFPEQDKLPNEFNFELLFMI